MTDNERSIYSLGSGAIGILEQEIIHLQRQLAEAQAERDALRAALDAVTKLPVGVCDMFDELDATSWVEPCSRCGEAHDIARAALEGKDNAD